MRDLHPNNSADPNRRVSVGYVSPVWATPRYEAGGFARCSYRPLAGPSEDCGLVVAGEAYPVLSPNSPMNAMVGALPGGA